MWRIKRKWATVLFLLFAACYLLSMVHLFVMVDSIKLRVNRLVSDRGLKPDQMNIGFQILKPDCMCHEAPLFFDLSFTKATSAMHHDSFLAKYDAETCDLRRRIDETEEADIIIPQIYNSMKLHYPHYIINHRGWVPDWDLTYSSHQWDSDPLEVFIVPHSHQDPGWLKSVDSYYADKTKKILDTVLSHMVSDGEMRFVWAEMVYLQKWYRSLQHDLQQQFKSLLQSGRFEVLTGGWVMTDEAVAHYAAILDQLIEGHQWLKEELDYTVQNAWSLDAFGVSPTLPYLLQRSGVKNLLVQRAHYGLKKALATSKQLEFFWRQAWDPGSNTDLFCHMPPFMLYNILYSCGPDPDVCCQVDFSKKNCYTWRKYHTPDAITDSNVEERSAALLDQLRQKAQVFRHNKLLFLLGDDFRFTDDTEWDKQFDNLKRMMNYMNHNSNMNVKMKFATLGEYFEGVQEAMTLEVPGAPRTPSLTGDFFPYNDRDDQFWSGYFTTRPFLKYMTRVLQAKLRAAELLFSLSSSLALKSSGERGIPGPMRSGYQSIQSARHTLGLLQHHDAITGTARAAVVRDYRTRIHNSIRVVQQLSSYLVSYLVDSGEGTVPSADHFITLDQQSTSKDNFQHLVLDKETNVIAVFNPLTVSRDDVLTVTASEPHVMVTDAGHVTVPCQLSPVFTSELHLEEGRFQVSFPVRVLPLSITRYYIKKAVPPEAACVPSSVKILSSLHAHQRSRVFHVEWPGLEGFVLDTPSLRASFCGCTGLLQNLMVKSGDSAPVVHPSRVEFLAYGTGSWVNPLKDKSGAYTFVPNGEARPIEVRQAAVAVVEGLHLSYVLTKLPLVSHTLTLYNTTGARGSTVHVDNTVDVSGSNNTELIMRLHSKVNNGDVFYTDLNGFQTHQRRTLPQLPIQGNYYPMSSHVFIEDDLYRLTLHAASSHGVASLKQGELEVMLDRRLSQDDWRGLSEGVLDNLPTHSSFILTLERRAQPVNPGNGRYFGLPSLFSHQVALGLNNPLQLFLQHKPEILSRDAFVLSQDAWPCDLHLVTLRTVALYQGNLDRGQLLLVVHRMGIDCAFHLQYFRCEFSSGELDLKKIFHDLQPESVQETLLTGTTVIDDSADTDLFVPPMEIKTLKLVLT